MDRQKEDHINLPPGEYIILPRTLGCRISKVYLKPYQNKATYLDDEGQLSPILVFTLQDIYRKFDMSVSDELSYNEMKALMETAGENFG